MAKNLRDEAFNAGKEIETLERLTLHRFASSLHSFNVFGAQLWVIMYYVLWN
jgi:hypothetical protein